MPKKSVGWPAVGRTSPDAEEHSKLILEEAHQLLNFGAPSDSNGTGKQCPYHTLNAFCTSVIAYLEASRDLVGNESSNHGHEFVNGTCLLTPSPNPSKKQLELGNSLFYKNFRRISTPLTSQKQEQRHNTLPSSETSKPLQIDTYGILALYVPSNFDVENQKRAIDGIESSNKGFIPGISIRSIEWLIPDWTKTKHYSNLLIEFEYPQHANAAIREQLLIGNKVLSCEYYERDSRLKQCFFCQQYRHQDVHCQALHPVCGRCAGHHVTSNCKCREDTHNFRCGLCGGNHRAWDSVCKVRQEELERVRNARLNAPKYHAETRKLPEDQKETKGDTPSREYAGTRRYSIDFLVEVNLRGGRKSRGRVKAVESRPSNLQTKVEAGITDEDPTSPSLARTKANYTTIEPDLTPQSVQWNDGCDRFTDWIRSRLSTLGIEPYSPLALKLDDVHLTPATPSPIYPSSRNRGTYSQGDHSSAMLDRSKNSLDLALRQVERSPSEKAANIAKIRNSDRWR